MDLLPTLRVLVLTVCPLAAVLVLLVFSTGWRRWVAAAVAVPTAGVLAVELYSGWVGGTLTGLLWILSLPLVLVAVGLLSAAELILRRSARRGRSSDAPTPARVPAPESRGSGAP